MRIELNESSSARGSESCEWDVIGSKWEKTEEIGQVRTGGTFVRKKKTKITKNITNVPKFKGPGMEV